MNDRNNWMEDITTIVMYEFAKAIILLNTELNENGASRQMINVAQKFLGTCAQKETDEVLVG